MVRPIGLNRKTPVLPFAPLILSSGRSHSPRRTAPIFGYDLDKSEEQAKLKPTSLRQSTA
jgi:hypothetical protein